MPVMAPDLKARSRPSARLFGGRLGGAHVGAHRDVHADEAGGARQHRADQEADGGVLAEEDGEHDEDDDADDGDGGVLAAQVGLAPSWIAAAISCMRALPASAAMTRDAVTTPYSTAMTPQPMTAQRTEDIWLTYCFISCFRRSMPEVEPPGARRAENDRTPPPAQPRDSGKIPVTLKGLSHRSARRERDGAAEDADHQEGHADQGEGQ